MILKRAEIIAVGTELLLGQIANTNAQFLAKHLSTLGYHHHFQTVVGDNSERLKHALEIASTRSDLIILTGGLGPTKDDLTKEVVSEFVQETLVYHTPSLEYIEQYFIKVNRPMTENNKKQALVINNAHVLLNKNGMAPGMVFESSDKQFVLLPGPPREMIPMVENELIPYFLKGKEANTIISKELKFFGIGESILETQILDLLENQSNPTIAPLASEGEVMLRITASASNKQEAEKLIGQAEEKIRERVGQFIYGTNGDNLFTVLSRKLKEFKLTISAAESLTGGLFSKRVTDIPGNSSIFKGSVVCYTNEMKQKLVNVSSDILANNGAVSAECAKSLVENIQRLTGSNISISFTGEAGPSTLENVPVGKVFIGIKMNDNEPFIKEFQFSGTREQIRLSSVKNGANMLIKLLHSSFESQDL
ncbi:MULTISPECIES: competence/damage-inducible protein A [unclassified Bacillus (in: firmicutes)]|uniref:competence/damage-inducible protein A n=1 Tax=unclassified Bacillus (in: firmicutes) TaxID=185979 RepID=UPI000BF213B4|nr:MULTISPECIES: competence/damage-inducible protein A [unclassified Bacillus (in: firmicutes)]PEJ60183.1 competence/damage-inducible protein A [Bacillus sp. AFS002410]PEK98587.1 competence/damage-inducible protein A [Bacillus sp. AFS017336]